MNDDYCLACGARMTEKPLFTSFYKECEPCELREKIQKDLKLEPTNPGLPSSGAEYKFEQWEYDLAKKFEELKAMGRI